MSRTQDSTIHPVDTSTLTVGTIPGADLDSLIAATERAGQCDRAQTLVTDAWDALEATAALTPYPLHLIAIETVWALEDALDANSADLTDRADAVTLALAVIGWVIA